MKKTRFLLCIAVLLSVQAVSAQKPAKLTVEFSFKGIVEGYDHNNYCEVWIDGVKAGESSRQSESRPNSVTVLTTRGKHTVEIKNFAEYEGAWEEHLIENDYSIDCYYNAEIIIKKKKKIILLFDIDSGTIVK